MFYNLFYELMLHESKDEMFLRTRKEFELKVALSCLCRIARLSLLLSHSLSVLVYCMRIFLKMFILVCVLRYPPIYGLCERNPWRNIQEGGIKWVAGFCNETQKARKGIQSEISDNHQVSTTINVWCIDFRK